MALMRSHCCSTACCSDGGDGASVPGRRSQDSTLRRLLHAGTSAQSGQRQLQCCQPHKIDTLRSRVGWGLYPPLLVSSAGDARALLDFEAANSMDVTVKLSVLTCCSTHSQLEHRTFACHPAWRALATWGPCRGWACVPVDKYCVASERIRQCAGTPGELCIAAWERKLAKFQIASGLSQEGGVSVLCMHIPKQMLRSMLLRRVCARPSVSVRLILRSISPGLHTKSRPERQSTAARLKQPSRLPRSQLSVSRRIASLGFATTAAAGTAMADHSLLTVHRIPCLTVRPPRLCAPFLHSTRDAMRLGLSGGQRQPLCLQDNYVWVLQEPSGKVAIVDPSEAEPVAHRLKELGLTPSYILNTHHHWDHTGVRSRRP